MVRTFSVCFVAILISFCFIPTAHAAELTAADVANANGDGPDGKGNTADDTWQFWFQLIHAPQYRRLDIATAAMPAGQRAGGIPGKVTGPIGSGTPNAGDTEGWIYHSDWDGRYEGVWGDKKANEVIAHPYNEKTDGGNVAITYKVPEDGTYKISGKVTDKSVVNLDHYQITGITYKLEVVAAGNDSIGQALQVLKTGKVGDKVGPESEEFEVDNVKLKSGQLVRLAIDPNKWWGADMTAIKSFKIEKTD